MSLLYLFDKKMSRYLVILFTVFLYHMGLARYFDEKIFRFQREEAGKEADVREDNGKQGEGDEEG